MTAKLTAPHRNKARSRKSDNRLSLNIDTLEARQMLAGNVTVFVNAAGDVTLAGDGAANEFTLDADDGIGGTDLVISGQSGTTITLNGTAAASHTVSLTTASTVGQHLKIFTRGGDDIVTIRDTNVASRLLVKTGSGNDTINLDNVTITENSLINTGSGDDTVNSSTNGTTVSNVMLRLGTGSDAASLANVTSTGVFGIRGSLGDDSVTFTDSSLNRIVLRMSGGMDDVQVMGTSVIAGRSLVDLGGARDTLSFGANVSVNAKMVVLGGFGADAYDGHTPNFTVAPTWYSVETRHYTADVVADQAASVGVPFSFVVPENGFALSGTGPTYSAADNVGNPLPGWLSFDGASRTLSGTPTVSDVGTLSVTVTATKGGVSVSDTFDIVVA